MRRVSCVLGTARGDAFVTAGMRRLIRIGACTCLHSSQPTTAHEYEEHLAQGAPRRFLARSLTQQTGIGTAWLPERSYLIRYGRGYCRKAFPLRVFGAVLRSPPLPALMVREEDIRVTLHLLHSVWHLHMRVALTTFA